MPVFPFTKAKIQPTPQPSNMSENKNFDIFGLNETIKKLKQEMAELEVKAYYYAERKARRRGQLREFHEAYGRTFEEWLIIKKNL